MPSLQDARRLREEGRDLAPDYEVEVGTVAPATVGRRGVFGAIVVGALVTLASHITLDLLGAGIGMGVIPKDSEITTDGIARSFAIGAAVWWLITTVVAVFLGAMVASRMVRQQRRDVAALQGLATWAMATVIWVFAMTTVMGGLLGGAVGAMNSSLAVVTARDAYTVRHQDAPPADAARSGGVQTTAGAPVVTEEDARKAARTAAAAALWACAGLLFSAGAGCAGGVFGSRPVHVVTNARTIPRPAVG